MASLRALRAAAGLGLRRGLASAPGAQHAEGGGGGGGGVRTWKILSFVVALPGVGVCMLNAWLRMQQHSHDSPEFVAYSHLRIRTKSGCGFRSHLRNLDEFHLLAPQRALPME
ncbi:cytochrome c oxidase subunit 6A, mitochondrial isoform X2 [Latimeria chalumnae]|uniref:cytochrome c oxidase subunit 6A, mitochondrial isoform X2 n=1 Tax=Latimeria chalumnae TaxID=7897 RepID=UPI00313D0D7A